uniref:CapA family protein n=1 Tax=Paractinoplanes polyasparticus TaxID=2856853 RepID=UPI001C860A28|nr:CapA family protein [Actinoplanes polyasparticus]
MNSHPSHQRPGIFGRPVLTVAIVLAVLAAIGVGSVAFANRDSGKPAASWAEPTGSTPAPPASSSSREPVEESASDVGTVTLSATGDIMMSNAPSRMPPADGAGFFDSVKKALASDLVMGNLEQPLTTDTGTSKCGAAATNCFAFRSPPSYAKHLRDGGFDLVNTANNHSKDFGTQGARNTREALDETGVKATGNTDEITVAEVKGIKVAVVGFSSYAGANSLLDLDQARSVVEKAKEQGDLVVVQVHMGAEGSDEQHVKPGTETFFGENRGDPMKFSRAVIDAGADLVVGHGPHVLRGMEFYKGKLIAYSLGNFAGGGRTLSRTGVLKYGGVLHVTLSKDGSYVGGKLLSTYMNSNGLPTRDESAERGRKLVAQLTKADFPETGPTLGADGSIKP